MREAIEKRLSDALEADHVEVIDESHLHVGHAGARDGGGHYRAVIVSRQFEGLSRVQAQQLVYRVLGDWMGKEIHAMSMKTGVPGE
jgi:BolA protein